MGPEPDIVRNGAMYVMLLLSLSLSSDEPQEVIMSHLLATGYCHFLSSNDRSLHDYKVWSVPLQKQIF